MPLTLLKPKSLKPLPTPFFLLLLKAFLLLQKTIDMSIHYLMLLLQSILSNRDFALSFFQLGLLVQELSYILVIELFRALGFLDGAHVIWEVVEVSLLIGCLKLFLLIFFHLELQLGLDACVQLLVELVLVLEE